jgi:hypothetical protein
MAANRFVQALPDIVTTDVVQTVAFAPKSQTSDIKPKLQQGP